LLNLFSFNILYCTIITNENSQLQLLITKMSATGVHSILSHLTANITLRLEVTGKYFIRSADDLIKGISYRYLFSTSSLASLYSALNAKVGIGNKVKPRQLM